MRFKKKQQDANLTQHYGKGKVIKSQEAWFQQVDHPNSLISFSAYSVYITVKYVIGKILHFGVAIILYYYQLDTFLSLYILIIPSIFKGIAH